MVAVTWAATSLTAVYGSFCNVLFPYLSAEADPERQRRLLATGLRYACPVLVGAVAALACVTPWLLPALFGAEFQASIPIAYALMAAYCRCRSGTSSCTACAGSARLTPARSLRWSRSGLHGLRMALEFALWA